MIVNPRGMGVYVRALSHHCHQSPQQTAQQARDHGLTFVPILACWQQFRRGTFSQRSINDPEDIARYAEALAAVGVAPAIWFYPWGGHELELLEHLELVIRVCDGTIVGLVPDPELGYKWQRGAHRPIAAAGANMRGPEHQGEAIAGRGAGVRDVRCAQARRLMGGLVNLMDEAMWLILTSYGIARFHQNFPWSVFLEYGTLSGQLYGADLRTASTGLEEWSSLAKDLMFDRQYLPSIATYGPTAQNRLSATLSAFDGLPIQGMLAWSWPQTDAREWTVLAAQADRFALMSPSEPL